VTALLAPGDRFPPLSLPSIDGATLDLPQALAGRYGVVLVYRGSWCPFCNAQLAAFEAAREDLAAIDTKIVALSIEDAQTTRALVEKHGIRFPIGYCADADAGGNVVVSVYSSGAIGRLLPADVAGLVRHLRGRAEAR
jgi:peroxiredoxin